MLQRVMIVARMIRLEHTVFALPFAYIGALLVEQRVPSVHDLLWITLAMVGARTAAMSLNRIIDRRFDAENPRTANRALPQGLLSASEVWIYVVLSLVLLFVAATQLSPLAVKLFPIAVVGLVFYSYTKRFTWTCHLWLGAVLGGTPLAGWVAVSDSLALAPVLLGLGVMFWVAGFDIIYACLDYDFDRVQGLHSIPARFGVPKALRIAMGFHVLAPLLFLVSGLLLDLGVFYYLGVSLAVLLLLYEHFIIVNRMTPERINMAFFQMNAALSMGMLFFTLTDVLVS